MQVNLAGRTAVITGASKGSGSIATRFRGLGRRRRHRGARPRRARRRRQGHRRERGGRVHAIQGDVAVPADVQRSYDEAMQAFGKIDIVVNNAGTSRTGAFEEITDEVWRED